MHERDNYTRIQMLTKYFSSRKYIFVVELENVIIEMHNKIQYPVMVSLPEVFIGRNVSSHQNSYLTTNCNGQTNVLSGNIQCRGSQTEDGDHSQ